MALIPIGPWKWDSTYRVHPLELKDSTYRVPLLDSKLVRLRYAWYYRIKSCSGPSSTLAALGTPQLSFATLNAVEPRLTYPNLYLYKPLPLGLRPRVSGFINHIQTSHMVSNYYIYMCLSWSKKHRRNYVGQTRACST